MPVDKKSSFWPVLFIAILAIAAPLVVGIVELRIARNARAETDAVEYLRAVAKAENDYRRDNNTFSLRLEDLKGLPKPGSFYKFGYRKVSTDSYLAMAWPNQAGKHGRRFFFLDQSGVVRFEVMHPAGPASEPVPTTASK